MRHRLFIPAATALLLGLAACTQDELADDNRLPEGEYPVVIRATGLSVEATPQAAPSTRATVDGDWQGVQTVALKMGDAVKEYTVTATDDDGYKSATLTCENDPHYWTSRDPITVSAWWPLDKADITQMPAVKVAADQSKLADFQNSDFISAENQTVKFDDPTLEFTHRTARVAIELKPGTGFTSVDGATVSLVSLSTDNGNPTAIQTYHASGNSYEALTAPQTVAKGEPFIRVELGGGNFYFRPQNDVVLEAGNRYTYTVKVNATGLTLEGCTIGGWEPGQGESGAAEEQQDYTYDTTTNTTTVYTVNGLMHVAELVNNGATGINIILTADITLPEVAEGESNWTPIGNYDNTYTGTFEGNGHTITGLTINQSETYFVGLIGNLGSDGKVQNLTLENVNITGLRFVGSVVGFNSGTVTACNASGSVEGILNVGGVMGSNEGGAVIACNTSVSVSGRDFVGGVMGLNADLLLDYETGLNGTVIACNASGSVKGYSDVGGVVGSNFSNDFKSTVTACCHVLGSVSGDDRIGGVVGSNSFNDFKSTVTACYWSDYAGDGIGVNNGIGETTQVTDDNWAEAVDDMNNAIETWNTENSDIQCEWRYALGTDGLPVLQKKQ